MFACNVSMALAGVEVFWIFALDPKVESSLSACVLDEERMRDPGVGPAAGGGGNAGAAEILVLLSMKGYDREGGGDNRLE